MQEVLDDIKITTDSAIPPLQKLEHAMHPLVAFVVMPIFALANAGVVLSGDLATAFASPVALGIIFGLIVGKVCGIVGFVFLFERLKIVKLPKTMSYLHLTGVAFLAAIGFTMSLFITALAFENETYILQAKIGILSASFIAGLIGYFLLNFSLSKTPSTEEELFPAEEEKIEDWVLGRK
jgi:NhaA family Na+:H+ antiporter